MKTLLRGALAGLVGTAAGIYDPPWRYPAGELALDFGYHLVYGAAVGEAFARF